MDAIIRDDVLNLLSDGGRSSRVSVFLGVPPREGVRSLQVRLEHQLKAARTMLETLGREREREVEALLEPAWEACTDFEFWRSPSPGLAMFVELGRQHTIWLPWAPRDFAYAGDQFHVKPVLPLLLGRGPFSILALSRNKARWLLADRYDVLEIEDAGLPQGITQVAQTVDFEKTLQLHPGPARRSGQRADPMFHGQGGVGMDDRKTMTVAYCRLIDRALDPLLKGSNRPLVLAGERALLARFRSVCSYPHVVDEPLGGNPDRTPAAELHAGALPLVRPKLDAKREQALASFREASTLALDDLPEVLARAREGRVATLFVAVDRERWGRPGQPGQPLVQHEEWEAGDVDLLDLTATESLRCGGEVHAVPSAELPGVGGLLAAVLRY